MVAPFSWPFDIEIKLMLCPIISADGKYPQLGSNPCKPSADCDKHIDNIVDQIEWMESDIHHWLGLISTKEQGAEGTWINKQKQSVSNKAVDCPKPAPAIPYYQAAHDKGRQTWNYIDRLFLPPMRIYPIETIQPYHKELNRPMKEPRNKGTLFAQLYDLSPDQLSDSKILFLIIILRPLIFRTVSFKSVIC